MSLRLTGSFAALAVALALALLLVPGTGPTSAPPGGVAGAQTSSVVETEVYARDARAFTDALFALGTTLQRVTPAGLDAQVARARTRLEAFRDASGTLAGYTVEPPVLERQRAALARAATPVADTFAEVLDALEARDLVAVRTARERAKRALADLARAARGRPPLPAAAVQ